MLNERNKVIENSKSALYGNSGGGGVGGGNNDNYNNSLMSNNSCMAASTTIIPFDDKLNIKHHSSDNNMNFIKNGQLSPSTAQKLSQITLSKCLSSGKSNGSGVVKAERLSPPLVNDLSIYR
jgi:hypothetical protein